MMYGDGEKVENKPLGFIAQKYESGSAGVGAIADVPGDGGGKAYGSFQLDSKFKNLSLYIKQSQYAPMFKNVLFASKSFDSIWKSIAATDSKAFEESQRVYITRRYYKPAERVAKQYGYDTECRAVQEAIFSISLQHGSWRVVLSRGRYLMKLGNNVSQIAALYNARRSYVMGLRKLTYKVKQSLMRRYALEERDVLSLYEVTHPRNDESDLQTLHLDGDTTRSIENQKV